MTPKPTPLRSRKPALRPGRLSSQASETGRCPGPACLRLLPGCKFKKHCQAAHLANLSNPNSPNKSSQTRTLKSQTLARQGSHTVPRFSQARKPTAEESVNLSPSKNSSPSQPHTSNMPEPSQARRGLRGLRGLRSHCVAEGHRLLRQGGVGGVGGGSGEARKGSRRRSRSREGSLQSGTGRTLGLYLQV